MYRANFATPLSIAPFGLGSLITSSARWMSHEDWSEELSQWYGQQRPRKGRSIGSLPKNIRKKQKTISATFGCWVLCSPEKPHTPMAFVELHGFTTSFAKVFLIVSAPALATNNYGYFRESLCLLLTATGLWGNLDIVDLYFVEDERVSTLGLPLIKERPCLIVDPDHNYLTNEPLAAWSKLYSIDMYEWAESATAASKREQLANLTTRVRLKEKRDQAELAKGKRRPPRGIMARIFRPWS